MLFILVLLLVLLLVIVLVFALVLVLILVLVLVILILLDMLRLSWFCILGSLLFDLMDGSDMPAENNVLVLVCECCLNMAYDYAIIILEPKLNGNTPALFLFYPT